jgi:hypothetical protein
MTLKEQFDALIPIEFGGMQDPLLSNCVEVAEEFAIKFAEWLANSYYSYNFGIKMFQHRNKEIYKTTKDLLEIYKKEKQL